MCCGRSSFCLSGLISTCFTFPVDCYDGQTSGYATSLMTLLIVSLGISSLRDPSFEPCLYPAHSDCSGRSSQGPCKHLCWASYKYIRYYSGLFKSITHHLPRLLVHGPIRCITGQAEFRRGHIIRALTVRSCNTPSWATPLMQEESHTTEIKGSNKSLFFSKVRQLNKPKLSFVVPLAVTWVNVSLIIYCGTGNSTPREQRSTGHRRRY